jgi:hypothetical protein
LAAHRALRRWKSRPRLDVLARRRRRSGTGLRPWVLGVLRRNGGNPRCRALGTLSPAALGAVGVPARALPRRRGGGGNGRTPAGRPRRSVGACPPGAQPGPRFQASPPKHAGTLGVMPKGRPTGLSLALEAAVAAELLESAEVASTAACNWRWLSALKSFGRCSLPAAGQQATPGRDRLVPGGKPIPPWVRAQRRAKAEGLRLVARRRTPAVQGTGPQGSFSELR